ncbi:hypothetical protein AB0C28_52565 [Nonomuraea sp. NPDC048892]|uniref:hypothetical protein n=1 Tax=Nonomuraea sp. NPDC048892 TaxID=3154624 RepID=UPI0033F2872E
MARLTMEDLPGPVFEAINFQCGQLLRTPQFRPASPDGSALLARLEFADGSRAVLKAGIKGTDAGELLRREMWVRTHCASVPGPDVRLVATIDQAHLLVTSYVNDMYHQPSLMAGTRDLELVMEGLGELSLRFTVTSVPSGAARAEDDLREEVRSAVKVLSSGVLPVGELNIWQAAVRLFDDAAIAGTTLLHRQWVPRHLLVTVGCPLVVTDWSRAAYGAAWVDLIPLGVHLVQAGHPGEQVEDLFARSFPCWRRAPYRAVTGYIATWALHQMLVASRTPRPQDPPQPGPTPALQPAALAWVQHRLRSS